MLMFSFPNLYAHDWKCPKLSKLCFLDVSGPTIHFSRVAVVNLHPAHQRSNAPITPWPVLHFWFGHFFPHGPFARWEARLLWSADWPFQVAWLARKPIFRKKRIRPFWPRASLSTFCRFSSAFKAIRIYLLKSVSCNSALLSNPLRCLPSIYLWKRVIIYNSAGL